MSNYAKYINCDLVNGKGVRCTLFFTGCSHGCKGCYNKSTWNPNSGFPITESLIRQILDDLEFRDGLSLSGGDPLHHRNLKTTTRICKLVKERYPDKDIWLWTGYDLDERFRGCEFLKYVDVVIDGRYVKELPTNKPFRGSDNQRMWEIKGSVPFLVA
ncbi:anaerobic ribonucleoside-triphosphate reductase activating protein [Vibrio parahaemolyticus]|nr:anaerobic ribonucleoside-triphosphate reductase activating protein [Vibrio parahaemolyticus]EHK6545812.1 anaerobic ribonucleoside-triphosphate reductase activating protein [Vibrio parahaemolyticus]ELJ1804460.1 anaerobic ribonucleoside-triphosphate reductase activating protein [Vibrio parahaemolyticus]